MFSSWFVLAARSLHDFGVGVGHTDAVACVDGNSASRIARFKNCAPMRYLAGCS